jgi:hypothetical protein
LIIMSSQGRVLFDVLCPKLTTFYRREERPPIFNLLRFFCSRAAASGGEDRRALGEKGVDPLFDIGAGEDPMAVGQGAVGRLLRCLVQRIAHARADEAQREGRATGQALGESNSGGQRLTGRRQAVDQANAMRLVSVNQFAGVEQLVGLRWTDEAGKPEDAAAAGEDAQLHLGKADTRRLVHDANIAGQGDLGSPA